MAVAGSFSYQMQKEAHYHHTAMIAYFLATEAGEVASFEQWEPAALRFGQVKMSRHLMELQRRS